MIDNMPQGAVVHCINNAQTKKITKEGKKCRVTKKFRGKIVHTSKPRACHARVICQADLTSIRNVVDSTANEWGTPVVWGQMNEEFCGKTRHLSIVVASTLSHQSSSESTKTEIEGTLRTTYRGKREKSKCPGMARSKQASVAIEKETKKTKSTSKAP